MFEIVKYAPCHEAEWNDFVARSKNGTFLFDRRYMDYHSDRFCDHSLLFYLKGRLYALLPACEREGVLYSHKGLTYGGLVMDSHSTADHVCEIFDELNSHLMANGFRKIVYKPVPHVFHKLPSDEDLFALTAVCKAHISSRQISSAIIQDEPVKWRHDRHYGANKGERNGLTVCQSNDFEQFWKILSDNLQTRFGAKPVHALQEIELLHRRFPDGIKLFAVNKNGQMLGGTVIYQFGETLHTQYISATPEGKQLHAIDVLFRQLLSGKVCSWQRFDFGTSNSTTDNALNKSLISQKEGFGGRAVCYDTYEWNL